MTLEDLYYENEMNMLVEVKILITSRYRNLCVIRLTLFITAKIKLYSHRYLCIQYETQ